MKDNMMITTYEQLKMMSDPLRAQVLEDLIDHPDTCQNLGQKYQMSKSRMNYHVRELEKNQLVEVIKKEEKNGGIQNIYRATAYSYSIDQRLIPSSEATIFSDKQVFLNFLDVTKKLAEQTPETHFSKVNPPISTSQIRLTREQYETYLQKERDLLNELIQQSIENTKNNQNEQYYWVQQIHFPIQGRYDDFYSTMVQN
ncbi:winged helix-turn-helix domain-containing protein [Listeria costaricensis]|uniref:winged helix-turn-helix domain-containing protein n=1 Tax=Listeria costaricensis TaxID=2026604 RepID=UPI000C087B80|nr:helix-turn-helix domain-containing protein [Listeria costaricensis]